VKWRFYEAADVVKTRWKIISFIFDPFWPPLDNNSPLWLCVDHAAAFTPHDQTPSQSLFERAT